MRVGIDATSWSNRRGYGRFTRGLLTALFREERPHQFTLFIDSASAAASTLPASASVHVVRTSVSPIAAASSSGRRSLPDMLRMSTAVARQRLDLFVFPTIFTYFPLVRPIASVIGIHDTIAEDYPELVFPHRVPRTFWNAKSRLARAQASWVMTVSSYARSCIQRKFGWPEEKMFVVGEAPDDAFRVARAPGGPSADRYFVYVGGINPHKNLPALVAAFVALRCEERHADIKLVIIGDVDTDTFTPGADAVRRAIAESGVGDAVRFTGFLPDAEAAALVAGAKALVLPSMSEGYGLPAVEAAACGVPVVATRHSPLPELLAGAGLFIDPASLVELQDAMRTMLEDEPARLRYAEQAHRAAQELSWASSARQFSTMIDEIERRGP